MYGNVFVDTNNLQKGIYQTTKPSIFVIEETMESFTKKLHEMRKQSGDLFFGDTYLQNLNQCKFVEIEIKVVEV